MAGIRGQRSIYPPKRSGAKKMFSGSDRSGPHMELHNYAVDVTKPKKPKGTGDQGKRHQKHYGKSA